MIDVVEVFSCNLVPFVEQRPFEKITIPPIEIISAKILETLEILPFS